jgi:hypothetical protein
MTRLWNEELTKCCCIGCGIAEVKLCADSSHTKHVFSSMPSPESVNEGRDNKKVYLWFCAAFIEPVVGTNKWKANRHNVLLRKFTTPSDEAFPMVVYQNNYAKWLHMAATNDINNQTVAAVWTSGGTNAKKGYNKKFCGWSREGLEQLNANYKKIQIDRREDKRFDLALLEYLKERQPKTAKTNTRANKENELTGFALLNSLPCNGFSDSDGDSVDDDGSATPVTPV